MALYDCAIIGAGPAGLTAGIYACRAGMSVLLLEGMFPGGQIITTHILENYPGFPTGINGADFGMLLQQHALNAGVEILYEEATDAKLTQEEKTITTASGKYSAKSVILCMGAQPKKLGVAGEDELTGRGVSYCATCDGAFYKNKVVAVVGGGDTALSDAVYLSNLAQRVYLIHRRDTFRGTLALARRVEDSENIETVMDSTVAAIGGGQRVESLTLSNQKNGLKSELPVDALFVAVGTAPRTRLVAGQVELNEGGYIKTDAHMRTSLPGVFAAGDVRTTTLRQVVTAAADGAIAATGANEFLMLGGSTP